MPTTSDAPLHALGAEDVLKAAALIKSGKIYDLDCGRWPGMPLWHGHPPFQVLAYRTPRGIQIEGDQTWLDSNAVGYRWHSDVVMGTVHTGTHIDALCHVTCGADNHWFGGHSANESTGDFGPLESDATEIPPIVTRGVLLDVAGAKGVDALEAHYEIGRADIDETLRKQGCDVRPGDTVIVRTGYLSKYPDPDGIEGHKEAGVNLEGAEYLLERGMVALGGDTESVESLPSGDPDDPQPVHRRVLVESGVYIIEMINCEELARDRVYEFCFVCLANKIKYATGSMVRPIAII